MEIKEALYKQCQAFIEIRLKTIQGTVTDIQESLQSETKSSAGDKHETGRAMLQLEREKAGHQLAEIQNVNQVLAKIDCSKIAIIIGLGSIIYTTKSNYFIAISAGVLKFNNDTFYAISANTPIGKLLISKTINDEINFRSNRFKITNVI